MPDRLTPSISQVDAFFNEAIDNSTVAGLIASLKNR
jgi:hypothetical protein